MVGAMVQCRPLKHTLEACFVASGGLLRFVSLIGWDAVESDRQFYMRRVTAERQAAARAVTPEARNRRMGLVEVYLQKLQAIPA